jgi:hypothetical protein
MTLTLLQSMRLNNSFADYTVLGSQYENEDGIREWHLAIWSESYPKIRTCRVSDERKPAQLGGAYLEAADQAISKWEAQPVWVNETMFLVLRAASNTQRGPVHDEQATRVSSAATRTTLTANR